MRSYISLCCVSICKSVFHTEVNSLQLHRKLSWKSKVAHLFSGLLFMHVEYAVIPVYSPGLWNQFYCNLKCTLWYSLCCSLPLWYFKHRVRLQDFTASTLPDSTISWKVNLFGTACAASIFTAPWELSREIQSDLDQFIVGLHRSGDCIADTASACVPAPSL